MCGRYLLNTEGNGELQSFFYEAERRISGAGKLQSGEIRPSEWSVIIKQAGCHVYADGARWGFPHERQTVFLARLETVLQKPMFSESMLYRRCLVPASGFYEWSGGSLKQKYFFGNSSGHCLYMAGLWKHFGDGDHFVIVTTEADETVAAIHDRMPVIFSRADGNRWLEDWQRGWQAASQAAPALERSCCEVYEQLTLF